MSRIALFVSLVMLAALPAGAHPAWGIVVSRAGVVYFSDLETVWRIDQGGRLSVARPGESGHHVHELAIDDAGNVYGPEYTYLSEAEGYSQGIWKMDAAGHVSYVVRPTRQFPRGTSIWRDRDGSTYAVEEGSRKLRLGKLVKRTAGGAVSVLAASFDNIAAIAFGPNRSLYVTDVASLRRVSPTGAVTTVATNLDRPDSLTRDPLTFGNLLGLAVTPSRVVYVADFRNRRVLKIAENGAVTVLARSDPPWSPTGVAVGPGGEIYILEVGLRPPATWIKPRIRKVLPNGRISIVAVVKSP